MKYINMVGLKRNYLTIISRVYPQNKRKDKVWWEAVCKCGSITILTSQDFKRKDGKEIKSCGCLVNRKGEDSPVWKGKYGLSSTYWSSLKSSAKQRNLPFTITKKFLFDLIKNQEYLCALSGQLIILNQSASLDRIDSKRGYTKDNVQWVHKEINRMKSNFSDDYFIKICTLVANNNKKNE